MIKKELIEKKEEIIKDIICNKCGESLKILNKTVPDHYCGIEEYTVLGIYGSKYLLDGSKYTFSLCEKCFDELRKTFKIPCSIEDEW